LSSSQNVTMTVNERRARLVERAECLEETKNKQNISVAKL